MKLFDMTLLALNTSAFIYLASCLFFFIALVKAGAKSEAFWKKSAALLVVAGFVLHTFGLAGRWYIGGISRPPWTNLYESLIFFAWGVALWQVYSQSRWKLTIVGVIAMPLVFILMGMGVMTPNKMVEPLIPALQSNWLKIHVIFGMLAYSAFTMSACFAFLHLMRSGASLSRVGGILCLMILMNLGIAGGRDFVYNGEFSMARTVQRTGPDGREVQMPDRYQEWDGGPVITRMETVPYGNIPFAATFGLFALSAFFMLRRGRRSSGTQSQDPSAELAASQGYDLDKISIWLFRASIVSFVAFFGWVGYQMTLNPALTMASNPYLSMLLLMSLFFVFVFWVISLRYQRVMASLPAASRLDELGYKNILFGFPFQTLLLITGAIWAYYAWGRSWGWDPKETWALITWFAYLIYLHGKLLMGWKPRLLSVIAILSFIILVFAFLGVNLVLSGLHSYGAA